MSSEENHIIIDSGEIKIVDKNKNIRRFFQTLSGILGYQGLINLVEYFKTGRTTDLAFAVTFISITTFFVLREVFFVTYDDNISIKDIAEVSITKGFRSKGDRLLNLKLNRRTRQLALPKYRAEQIAHQLNELGVKSGQTA